tara:strand:+ start:118 stop:522 length:405 start_codon:yes stop_codon:yes gene_type:complete
MSDFTTYLETRVLDFWLNGNGLSSTSPGTLYVALHTANPGEAGSANEASGSGYARQVITFGSAATDTAGATSISNDSEPVFGAFTGPLTFTHVSITDAVTGGNVLFYGDLSSSKTVANTDSLRFTAGNVSVTLD